MNILIILLAFKFKSAFSSESCQQVNCTLDPNSTGERIHIDLNSLTLYNKQDCMRDQCVCSRGYFWDGELKICEPIKNYCSIFNPCGPDKQRAECQIVSKFDSSLNKRVKSPRCACHPAYSGTFCEKKASPCDELIVKDLCGRFECVREPKAQKGFRCVCDEGFIVKSNHEPECVDIDECSSLFEACKNGARCVNTLGSYKCLCLPEFTGANCEIAMKKERGQWSDWKSYEPCSVSCGDGHRTAYRKCSVDYGCSGQDSRTERCNLGECKIEAHSELFKMSLFNDDLEKYKVLELAYNKMSNIYDKFFRAFNVKSDENLKYFRNQEEI